MKLKKAISTVIAFTMLLTLSPIGLQNRALAQEQGKITDVNTVKPYDDVREKDLTGIDFRGKSDLLFTLTFDTYTKWPGKEKLPNDFDPVKLMEQGKDPGLNIKKLQQQGYNGKGVTIAYVDQHLLLNHEAYKNVKLHNYEIQNENGIRPSMHGPAVLSLLAGKEEGMVPDSEVYFFGHDGGTDDNEYEARAFEKIVEINKTLPDDKKIKVVGMSHGADDHLDKKNAQHLREAQAKARKSGIIVVDVSCGMATCGITGFMDRNDYKNYHVSNWEKEAWKPSMFNNQLIVPADHRTTAIGYNGDPKHYAYFGEGGFSWGVPYITGVITMALQINPKLTEKEAFEYLHKSADKFMDGDVINPEAFLNMVRQNCSNPLNVVSEKDYRYFLYNKSKLSDDDLKAINQYTGKFNDGTDCIIQDVSQYSTATDIYDMLKKDSQSRKGQLLGIQIFGTSEDVPAFDIRNKIQMKDSVDDGGNFKSDFFYSNFKSDSNNFKNDFSIYKAFSEKLKVSFVPEWTVSRLPLTKGEIAPFMSRNDQYSSAVNDKPFEELVNFSNPIFASENHNDDFGLFLKERMDSEFKILKSDDYKLFGNKDGEFPVKTKVLGNFVKENLSVLNKEGIKEFIINSHGQFDNIDQCIYTSKDPKSEKRISLVNKNNINAVLYENYYNLDLWTCLNGYNLDGNNLVHEAMANGKCISAMAASSTISNNGVHNDASLTNMKKNNFYYFYFNYLYNRALGKSRSESFTLGQQAYAQEILKNTNMLEDGNYQFNLHNVLSYHYLGLIEYWNVLGKNNFRPVVDTQGNSYIPESSKTFDGNVKFQSQYQNAGFMVKSLKAALVGKNVEFTLSYESPRNCDMCLFNPPNGDKIGKILEKAIKKGTNTYKISLSMDEFNKAIESETITMRFGIDDKSDWIFFNTSQLKPLLNSNKNTASFDGNVKFETDYTNKGFKIKTFKAAQVKDNFELTLSYESPRDCDFSLFNPPNGDKIMKIVEKAIKKGSNNLKISLTKDEFNTLLEADTITMRFGFNENPDWVFFNTAQLKPLLNSNNTAASFDGNVKFQSEYQNSGFKVKSLKAALVKDKVEFTLSYESSRNCDFSFFSPPNGEKIMKIVKKGIKKGSNAYKITLTKDEFNKLLESDIIAMRFGFEEKADFISFETSQLKTLLN